jgi:transcriptional regulator with XRE-family HTH domain
VTSRNIKACAAESPARGPLTAEQLVAIDCSIGAQLQLHRLLVGLSQEAVSKHLGLTYHQLQQYEQGKSRFSGSDLDRMSAILKVPVSYFFETVDGEPDLVQQAYRATTEVDEEARDLIGLRKAVELLRAFHEDEKQCKTTLGRDRSGLSSLK